MNITKTLGSDIGLGRTSQSGGGANSSSTQSQIAQRTGGQDRSMGENLAKG